MASIDMRRIVSVSSKELEQGTLSDEPLLYRFAFAHLLRLVNRSIYRDMRRMEQLLRDSDADWTVVRPAGLFAADRVSDYLVTTDHAPGVSTSIADLADVLVAEATSLDSHVGKVVTVLTVNGAPAYLRLLAGQRALHQR